MYKILNKLFGWDYVFWRNSVDSGIARIRKAPDGKVWYWRYWSIDLMDIVAEPKQVTWLTCLPEKYLTKETKE
jgi:hypothetical protein